MELSLFSRNKALGVQSFLVRIVNNNCEQLRAMLDGPRVERRVNLTMAVVVVPIERKRPAMGQVFTALTKEISSTGLGLVLDEPRGLDEVIVGFRWEGETTFLRGKAKHLSPMGGGFYQLGLEMRDVVPRGKYPQLDSLVF